MRVMQRKTLLGFKPSPTTWLPQRNLLGVPYFERIQDGLRVFESLEEHDEEAWLHVSLSYPEKLPTWDDMKTAKALFCGASREAYIVFPAEKRYVNDHRFVLHLWCQIDGPVLPDFRRMAPWGRMTI